MAASEESVSAWAPLRRPLFRGRWIASILSNSGSWMQDTAATWLMAFLTTSPLLVALMQTAASLPVLALGLLAGALADVLDRRRLLIFWQAWMLAAAVLLSVFTMTGHMGPAALILFTLLLNVGAAMNNPAWQAIVPELVPRAELSEAISLNSAGFNLTRAVGPAMGGLLVAAFARPMLGAGVVFLFNAASFLFVIVMLYRWKRQPTVHGDLPAERMLSSVRAGARYARHAVELRGILVRAALLTSCVSAMWALLPVIAREDLHGALGYGLLNACIGLGAIVGALLLPKFRARVPADRLLFVLTFVFVAALLVMAFVHQVVVLVVALMLAGVAWTGTTSTFNIAVQVSVPSWVQARALGTYQMVFQGGLALGSAAWGTFAERWSTRGALSLAAAGLLGGLFFARRYPILHGPMVDLSPMRAAGLVRSVPLLVIEPKPDDGPVRIMVDYRIDPAREQEFVTAIKNLKTIRLRDGAMRWSLFSDPGEVGHFQETFLVDSWSEYLRQRERITVHDAAVREQVHEFQLGDSPPSVSRMIYTPTA